MSEKLKAWAVVNEYGILVGLHADEKSAIAEARERLSVDLPHDWIAKDRVVIELVEKEPEQKLVLNEDQYKELIKLNEIKPRFNAYGALSMVLESIDCVNLRKVVSADDNIAQAKFAHLWAQLESTDIDDLVKVIKPNAGIMDKEQIKFTTDEFIALHKALEILMINHQERKAQKSSVTFGVEDGKKARITFEDLSDYENNEEEN